MDERKLFFYIVSIGYWEGASTSLEPISSIYLCNLVFSETVTTCGQPQDNLKGCPAWCLGCRWVLSASLALCRLLFPFLLPFVSPSFRACVSLACLIYVSQHCWLQSAWPLSPSVSFDVSRKLGGCFFSSFVFLLFDFASSCVGWDGGLWAFVICVYHFASPFWNLSPGLVVGVHPSLTLGTCYQLLLLGFKAWKLWLPVLHMKVCGTWVSCLIIRGQLSDQYEDHLKAWSSCVFKLTPAVLCWSWPRTMWFTPGSKSFLVISIIRLNSVQHHQSLWNFSFPSWNLFVFSGGRVIPLQSFSIGTQIQEVGILKFASESWVPRFWQFWDFEITKIGLSCYTPEV